MNDRHMRDAHFAAEVERLSPSFEQVGQNVEPDWYATLLMMPALLLRPLEWLLERDDER